MNNVPWIFMNGLCRYFFSMNITYWHNACRYEIFFVKLLTRRWRLFKRVLNMPLIEWLYSYKRQDLYHSNVCYDDYSNFSNSWIQGWKKFLKIEIFCSLGPILWTWKLGNHNVFSIPTNWGFREKFIHFGCTLKNSEKSHTTRTLNFLLMCTKK